MMSTAQGPRQPNEVPQITVPPAAPVAVQACRAVVAESPASRREA
jgi:hypothetical protein